MAKRYASDDDTSDSDFDATSQSDHVRRSIRYSSKPTRLGANTNNDFSFDESSCELFGEDSCEEENYAPPLPKRRKERKIEHARTLPKSYQNVKNRQKQSTISYDTSRYDTPDFNSQFKNVAENHGSLKRPDQIITTMKSGLLHKKTTTVAPDADATNHHHNGSPHPCCKNTLDIIEKKMDEVLARITVFERRFINGQMTNIKIEENLSDPTEFEQREAFMKSNRMPIENLDEFIRFEHNLKISEFSNTVVSLLPTYMIFVCKYIYIII